MKSLFIALSGLLIFTACSKPQVVPQAPQKIELVLPPDSRTVVDTKVIQKKEEVKLPETLAVVDIRVAYNSDLSSYHVDTKNLEQNIGEQIQAAFLRCGKYQLVERIRIAPLKTEIIDNDSDWFNKKQINEFGNLVGAKYLARVTAEVIVTPSVFGFTANVKTKVFIFTTQTGIAVEDFEVESKAGSADVVKTIYRAVDGIKKQLIAEIRG